MIITQFRQKSMYLAAIEASLRHDEHIAAVGAPMVTEDKICGNAIVIADQDGNITGWFDGDTPLCIFGEKTK